VTGALFDAPGMPARHAPLVIAVAGHPAPQGSKSAFPVRAGPQCPACRRRPLRYKSRCPACGDLELVPVAMREQVHDSIDRWRGLVAAAGARAMRGKVLLDGPLAARMIFTVARAAGHYRTGRYSHLLRDDAPAYPDYRGSKDLSKLLRATEDALTGPVWADDCRLCEYTRLGMFFAGEDPEGEGLDVPGVLIKIWRML